MSKKKKEKITYIDDGRTIADMSSTFGGRSRRVDPSRPRSSAMDKWNTYIAAVKMMFVPMLVVVCAIIIVYMLFSLIGLILY